MGGFDALHRRNYTGNIRGLFIEAYDRWALLIIDIPFWGTLGTLSVAILFYILAKLSERLGSVERMSPLYRYYYVALILWVFGYITQLLVAQISSTPESFPHWSLSPLFLLFAYSLPLAIGATIGLIVTWHYWSWLVTESRK